MSQPIPKVSVVMSVFNNEADVAQAIESILMQSMSDFEFVIIDDASTDSSPSIIQGYAQKDQRIRVISNSRNAKLATSLNKGIAIAQSQYIARMDADDVAMPNRLFVQYQYMQTHPNIAVCGAWVELYENAKIIWKTSTSRQGANCSAFFESCFHHPTVMIRKSVLDQFGTYDEEISTAQDCHLWSQLAFDHQQALINLPQVLLRYRSHPDKQREQYRADQHAKASSLRKKNLLRLGIDASAEQYHWHDVLCCATPIAEKEQFRSLLTWIDFLEARNLQVQLLSSKHFQKELNKKFLGVCLASAPSSIYAVIYFIKRCWKEDVIKNAYRALRMVSFYLLRKKTSISAG